MAEKKTSSKKPSSTVTTKVEKKVEEKKTVKSSKAPKASAIKTEKKTEKKMTSGSTVTLKQVKSGAGRSESQIGTLVGLGLNKLNKVATLQDSPSVRGMIEKVKHLVKIVNANK